MKASHRDQMFDLMSQGIWQVDAAGKTTFVNKRMAAMLGYTPEEFRLIPALALVPEADRGAIAARIASRGHGARDDLECQITHKDGFCLTVTVEAVPLVDANGRFEGTIALITDVTELRATERALRESEAWFRAMFENTPVATAVGDLSVPGGKITVTNKAFQDLLGYTAEEADGLPLADITHPDDLPATNQLTDNLRLGAVTLTYNKRIVRKDGTALPVQIATARVTDAHGRAFALAMIVDLSAEVAARIELERSRDRLRALGARLAAVAEVERRRLAVELHDVIGRNLTVLGMRLDVLSVKANSACAKEVPPQLADARRLVVETADRVREMMQGLRPSELDDFGLIPAIRGAVEHTRTLVTLDALDESYRDAAKRLPPDVEITLFRIVQEALHNMAKHAQAKRLTVFVDLVANPMRVAISDDGVGFERNRARDAAVRPGWGLIHMAERTIGIGATLHIDSSPGHGTCVTVEMPCPRD